MLNKSLLSQTYRNDKIAFAVVVLASYLVYFTNTGKNKSLEDNLLIIGLGLIYFGIGLVVSTVIEQRRNPYSIAAYFLVQIPLGFVIIYLGDSLPWLILLPMVGSAVELLPRPLVFVACALILFAQLLPFYLLFGWETTFMWVMPLIAAMVFVAVFTQMTVSEQKARAELDQAHRKLREYAVQVEELAIAEERNRLAREIHDGLGHYLTAVNIQIKAALAMSDQDPALTQEALKKAQTLTQEALADVRRSISSLRQDTTSGRPISETLSRLVQDACTTGVEASFTTQGTPRPLNSQVEFTLFRIGQEGLTNVRKHAQAQRVELCLEYLQDSVRFSIQDDGVGASQTGAGFGLMGLRERLELLGGQLTFSTSPGKGFLLQAKIPV
jgi:signal transduction histidine kinase